MDIEYELVVGACKECYSSNPEAGRNYFYLCTNCENFVSTKIEEKEENRRLLLRRL